MKKIGIYTLANDVVYDQLVALINSIEANVSSLPICIIPYDQRLDLVKPFVNSRENVSLYDNWESLQRWDKFASEVWAAHPAAKQTNLERNAWYKSPLLRKLAAYDGEFEQFVFYDADSLAMKPLDSVWQKLETYDFIFDDWEHIKPRETAALDLALIEESGLYQEKDVRPKLHCSSFFASKQGIFSPEEMLLMKKLLIEQGEIAWVTRWWDDAFLFNYLTLRCHRPFFNFTLSPDGQEKTGNCANADPFVNIDNVLYNKDGLKPIHRLHYMGYTPTDFARLSRGEDVNIRYRDEFLYYRFLKQPEHKPKHLKPPSILSKTTRLLQKVTKKVQRTIS